jgi:hypothetical protein
MSEPQYAEYAKKCDTGTEVDYHSRTKSHLCYCGGVKENPEGKGHATGTGLCFREFCQAPQPAGKHKTISDCQMWLVDGTRITDFTMRQQRGYHRHSCGCWSRSKSGSINSIEEA